jgi:hypothetical protein
MSYLIRQKLLTVLQLHNTIVMAFVRVFTEVITSYYSARALPSSKTVSIVGKREIK